MKFVNAITSKIKRKTVIVAALLMIGLSQLGGGLYIHAKAQVANWLIDNSWDKRSATATPQKPWPWADTWIVARLSVPRLHINQYVMQDTSGESLAFGPGTTANISVDGYNILAGHRDTHFSYLDKLQIGDNIEIETFNGEKISYKIIANQVIDIRNGPLNFAAESSGLSMITCWPMDAVIPGSPLRYIVSAERVI